MQRIPISARADWRRLAELCGSSYHTLDGEPYWDETAYYAFSLREIEDDLEAATKALYALCVELVVRAVADERILSRLAIPERFWNFIAASWKRHDLGLYGRFDLRYDGSGPPKLLEYNMGWPHAATAGAKLTVGWRTVGGRSLKRGGLAGVPQSWALMTQ
jgi:glutathionylspermidine synthase